MKRNSKKKGLYPYRSQYASRNQFIKDAKKGAEALKKVNELYRDAEEKFLNYNNTGTSDAVLEYPLTEIAEGSTTSSITRMGIKIAPKSLDLRYTLERDASAAAKNEAVRVLVVRDSQQVGDTRPSLTDVLESASVTAHYKRLTPDRFKILYDKVHLMSDNWQPMQQHRVKKSWKTLNVYFNGSASTDIQRNGLYFYVFSDNQQSGKGATLIFDSRIRFTDS